MAVGAAAPPLSRAGDCALVVGLESDGGKLLNGRRGIATEWIEAAQRFEVRLGPDKVVRLKPENLQKVELGVSERLRILGLAPKEQQTPQEPSTAADDAPRAESLQGVQGPDGAAQTHSGEPSQPGPERERSRSPFIKNSSADVHQGAELDGRVDRPLHKQPAPQAPATPLSPSPGMPSPPMPTTSLPSMHAAPLSAAAAPPPMGQDVQPSTSATSAKKDDLVRPGQCVEVFGLESDAGKCLNGQTGIVTRYFDGKDRFEVRFIPDKLVSLKADNLRKVDFNVVEPSKAAAAKEVPPVEEVPTSDCRSRSRSRSNCSSSSSSSSCSRASLKRAGAGTPARPQPPPTQAAAQTAPGLGSVLVPGVAPVRSPVQAAVSTPAVVKEIPVATAAQVATASPSPELVVQPLSVGDRVEVFGLESAGGRGFNGKQGSITKYLPDRDRFEVSLAQATTLSLKPENLKQLGTGSAEAFAASSRREARRSAVPEVTSAEQQTAPLSSLLAMGRAEPAAEPKPRVWESVWSRSGSKAPSGKLNQDQMEFFHSLQEDEERREEDQRVLRAKVKAELVGAGHHDEEMLEAAFQQRWEDLKLRRLLRPEAPI